MGVKILVTGHRGFVGSHLMKVMPDAIGIDLKDGNDILDCELPEADIVIHLAAEAGVLKSMQEPFNSARTNVLGTIRLLEKYKKSLFIFASSGGTIQDTIESPYGLSKYTCEEYIKLLHKNYRILRFANVYGPGSRSVVDKFLNGPVEIYGDGSATRTYAHVNDIVEAIVHSRHWETGTYKLGGSQNYTVLDIAEAVGKPIKFLPKKKGELLHSSLKNVTPDWEPQIELMRYIYAERHNTI